MLPTRNSVLLWTCAFASGLALAAASTAGATVRTAPYTWAPAAGPVAGYYLYLSINEESEQNYGWVSQPNAVFTVEPGDQVILRVAAFDVVGRIGPRSDPSPPLRLCPGDFDGDELIELTDLTQAHACLLRPATGACSGGDLDEDGNVSFQDYQLFEVGADACEGYASIGGCLGDMNSDGIVSTKDIPLMKACIGLYGQGNCEEADFDGNGFVTGVDVVNVSRHVGTTCSN